MGSWCCYDRQRRSRETGRHGDKETRRQRKTRRQGEGEMGRRITQSPCLQVSLSPSLLFQSPNLLLSLSLLPIRWLRFGIWCGVLVASPLSITSAFKSIG